MKCSEARLIKHHTLPPPNDTLPIKGAGMTCPAGSWDAAAFFLVMMRSGMEGEL